MPFSPVPHSKWHRPKWNAPCRDQDDEFTLAGIDKLFIWMQCMEPLELRGLGDPDESVVESFDPRGMVIGPRSALTSASLLTDSRHHRKNRKERKDRLDDLHCVACEPNQSHSPLQVYL